MPLSHTIHMSNHQVVQCYEHTNESIIEKVKRYYEGHYALKCTVKDGNGTIIYKSDKD